MDHVIIKSFFLLLYYIMIIMKDKNVCNYFSLLENIVIQKETDTYQNENFAKLKM